MILRRGFEWDQLAKHFANFAFDIPSPYWWDERTCSRPEQKPKYYDNVQPGRGEILHGRWNAKPDDIVVRAEFEEIKAEQLQLMK